MTLDSVQRRALLAWMLMDAGDQLALWLNAQKEAELTEIPMDDDWGKSLGLKTLVAASKSEQNAYENAANVRQNAIESGRSDLPKPVAVNASAASASVGTSRSMASFMALNDLRRQTGEKTATERQKGLILLQSQAIACRRCVLGGRRRNIMWGMGPVDASLMFVAAGGNPAELDEGRILTGAAAELLDKIVLGIRERLVPEISLNNIYMTNIIKCACIPPRAQRMDVSKCCISFLREEVKLVKPKMIVVWGEFAYRAMFGGDELISQVRGKMLKFDGIRTIATHHPLEMIDNPKLKARVWEDLKMAVSMM